MPGRRSLREARQYLPYIYVNHQRNITTLYLYYIDYKIQNNITAALRTIVDTLRKSYDQLPVDIREEYSQLVTEVKALWLQKKNRGEVTNRPTSTVSSAGDPYAPPRTGKLNNMGIVLDDDERSKTRRLMEERAVRLNGFLSSQGGATAIMNDVLIFADVVALINEPMPNREDWLVSEICLASYSARRGVISTYHEFVDPGKIWLGYRAQFNEHNEMHHIPEFFNQAVPKSKLDEVYQRIAEFVRYSVKMKDPNVLASGIIPVICPSDSVQKVDYALNEFIRESYLQMTQVSPREVFKFESFALEDCIMAFFNHSPKLEDADMGSLATRAEMAAMNKQFDNMPHLMCMHHDDTEALVCAMANAKKLCYSTSSALKTAFDFNLTANHMPEQAMSSNVQGPTSAMGASYQDCESRSAVDSDFRGAAHAGVSSTVIGASRFEGSQFSSDVQSHTRSSQYSAQPASIRYHAPPPGPAPSTISASTFVTQNTPRQLGDNYQHPVEHSAKNASKSSFRPFECDDDNESTLTSSTFRTSEGTSISSSFGRSRFRGRGQVKAPPGPPGISTEAELEMSRGFDQDDDDDIASLSSSMMSMGRGRGRGRGYRVPNQQ